MLAVGTRFAYRNADYRRDSAYDVAVAVAPASAMMGVDFLRAVVVQPSLCFR
jgi:hypothetical protein